MKIKIIGPFSTGCYSFFKLDDFNQVVDFLRKTRGFSYEATRQGIRIIFDKKEQALEFKKQLRALGESNLLIAESMNCSVEMLNSQWDQIRYYWNHRLPEQFLRLPSSKELHVKAFSYQIESAAKCVIL